MKLDVARRRRVPRAAGVRRAARAAPSGSASTRSSLHDVDEARLGAHRAGARRARRTSAARELPFRATTDLDDARRGRRLRVLRDPRRPARGPRRRRARPARARACSARRRPGPGGICFALRTVPVMVRLAETVAEHAPRRLVRQLHEPGRARHRGGPAGARRAGGRHLRLADGAVPARRRARSAATRTTCGSTTSGSTTSAGCAASTTATRDLLPGPARRRRARSSRFEEGALFGGEWLRSLGMIPNEYLYYYYYAPTRSARSAPGSSRAREFLLAPAARRSTRGTAQTRRGGARRLARHAARARGHVLGRGAQRRRARRAERRPRRRGRLRGRGDGRRRGDRAQPAPRADPQHRQPQQPAVPRRARGRRGAVRRRPRRRRADRRRRRPRRTRAH